MAYETQKDIAIHYGSPREPVGLKTADFSNTEWFR